MTKQFKLKKSKRTKHDELFKVMISEFLYPFLQGFFPGLAIQLEQSHQKALKSELFGKENSRKRQADLVFEMKSKEGEEVIIHIEGQSQRVVNYQETVFAYNSRLTEEHCPTRVISIVVYGHDCQRDELDNLQIEVLGFKVWDFRFLRLQLDKLDWREYENQLNPVVAAMLSRMAYQDEEKVDVKLAHLRTLAKLDLSEEDIEMFRAYFDTYLKLSVEEKVALKKRLGESINKEGLKMIRYMTADHEDGIKEGIIIGREEGRKEGIEIGKVVGKVEGKAEGKVEGKAEGKVEGKAEGQIDGMKDLAKKLLEMGSVTLKDLVKATNLPEEEFQQFIG